MAETITYVGLDVHNETIAVALAATGKRGEVRDYGTIANTPTALTALASKLAKSGATLHFCYKAGPCGYGIQRQLSAAGHDCVVVVPSLIPRRPGERIKTDRWDAANLARLHRAGELTPVWIPDQAHGSEHCSEQPRSGAGASGGDTRPAPSPPTALRLPAAARPPLQPTSLDADAPALAGRAAFRTGGPPHRP